MKDLLDLIDLGRHEVSLAVYALGDRLVRLSDWLEPRGPRDIWHSPFPPEAPYVAEKEPVAVEWKDPALRTMTEAANSLADMARDFYPLPFRLPTPFVDLEEWAPHEWWVIDKAPVWRNRGCPYPARPGGLSSSCGFRCGENELERYELHARVHQGRQP